MAATTATHPQFRPTSCSRVRPRIRILGQNEEGSLGEGRLLRRSAAKAAGDYKGRPALIEPDAVALSGAEGRY